MTDHPEAHSEPAAQAKREIPVWRQFWDQPPEPEALRDWTKGLTPGLIAAALWLPWVIGVVVHALPYGGIRHTFFGSLAGAWAALPLFLAAAFTVRKYNKPARQIIAGAFGPNVGPLVVLCTQGVLALFVLTIAINTAADWYFRTLAGAGMLAFPPSPVIRYLTTTTWALWVIPIGYGMVRIIAALIDYVPILIAIVLSTLFLLAIRQLQLGEPSLIFPTETLADPQKAFWNAFSWTFGYACVCSVFAADWGLGLKRGRDVVLGGITGLGGGLSIVSAMSLLCFAAASRPGEPLPSWLDLLQPLGHWPALAAGLLIGTYTAAPGVFASYHVLQALRQVFPKVHHYLWLVLKIGLIQVLISLQIENLMSGWAAGLSLALLVLLVILRIRKK